MENKFSKMMFALVTAVMLSVSSVYATWVNVQVTPGSWASEISWTLSDASGAIVASTNTGYYTASGVSVDYWDLTLLEMVGQVVFTISLTLQVLLTVLEHFLVEAIRWTTST